MRVLAHAAKLLQLTGVGRAQFSNEVCKEGSSRAIVLVQNALTGMLGSPTSYGAREQEQVWDVVLQVVPNIVEAVKLHIGGTSSFTAYPHKLRAVLCASRDILVRAAAHTEIKSAGRAAHLGYAGEH